MEVTRTVPSLSEAAILSTCNRTELYCNLDPAEEPTLQRWLSEHRRVPMHELASVAYSYWDQDAARHLIRVAAGLDSQVLGEPQIMGQVTSAYDLARNLGTLGPELNLLSQITLNAAKRVRTDTDVGRNPVSVAYAAVTMARQIFSDLSRNAALLLGAGDTIERVAEHLVEQGIGRLAIANRTLANAETLAARFGAEPMQLTEAPARLHEFDLVIASTGSALPIIGKGAVEAAIRQRRHRPMFMVDIAVPRDIEPEVADLSDVFLYSIDDLTELIEANLRDRKTAADSAEELVSEGTRRYVRERRAHQGQQILRRFRDQAQVIQGLELEKALRELENGADPSRVLAQLSQSLTNKLIHAPTVAIRNASSDGRADLLDFLKSLYRLD
jgi:glutamyl-tRNA reductase